MLRTTSYYSIFLYIAFLCLPGIQHYGLLHTGVCENRAELLLCSVYSDPLVSVNAPFPPLTCFHVEKAHLCSSAAAIQSGMFVSGRGHYTPYTIGRRQLASSVGECAW